MTVYADTLFVVNATMDFLALYLTSRILRIAPSPPRFLFASALGGLYGVLSLFLEPYPLPATIVRVLCALLLCIITFGKRSLLLPLALFYLTSFLLGGAMTAFFSALSRLESALSPLPESEALLKSTPLRLILCALSLSLSLLLLLQKTRNRRLSPEVTVKIALSGKTATFLALTDSGHFLTEPLSGLSVILLPQDGAKTLLPPDLLPLFSSPSPALAMKTVPPAFRPRLRLLPMTTATSKTLTIALRPDAVFIADKPVSAYIAFAPLQEALIPPDLVS